MATGVGATESQHEGGSERWRGRLKKLFHKTQHSFGYIECLEFDGESGTDDVYLYAMDLVMDLDLGARRRSKGDNVQSIKPLIGEFLEFTPQHHERGVKAMPPFELLRGDFQGRLELEEALDQRRGDRTVALDQRRHDGAVGESERLDIRCQGYVESLRKDLAVVLQMQAEAREDLAETPADYLRWYALQNWNPEKAFAGASLGPFSELARKKFGDRAPKKVSTFAQSVSAVNMWKNKGSPYVYPSEVFKMLNRFGESDIEFLHKNPTATAALCGGCSCPRIVGREDPNDHVWRCVKCFIAWYGWYPWTDAGVEMLAERGGAMGRQAQRKGRGKGKKGKK